MNEYLQYLIEHQCFITTSLLRSNQFISYCKKRNVKTSKKQLEQFEKLGIFCPIARVAYPTITYKIERIQDSPRSRRLGRLEDGEEWQGEVYKEYADFWFEQQYARNWFEHDLLWEPSKRPFQAWESFIDEQGRTKIESFYSPFQCYTLYHLMRTTRSEFRAEWWIEYTDEDIQSKIHEVSQWAHQVIDIFQKNGVRGEMSSTVCQVISNRYAPKTLSDRRSVRVSTMLPIYYRWDWYKYCRNWNANAVLDNIGIEPKELKGLQEILALDAKSVDPLEKWYDLVDFVSLNKKNKLKGNALLAQSFYAMEKMLRLFYEDITGERLYPPSESKGWERDKFYGEGVTNDVFQYLEFLTNEYNLNPRPKLILVVEGYGEEEQFPRLSEEFFGYPFSRLGIKVWNIRGVANFVGEKGKNPYSALEKFIDYQHHHEQTFVFVVLDSEGGAGKVKERLIRAKSILYPGCFITKEEYVHLWKTNIEFDNFSDIEIAHAMTQFCQNKYVFMSDEVAECRKQSENTRGRSGEKDYLSCLFTNKTGGYGSNKRELLNMLFTDIIEQPENEFAADENLKRPVLQIMQKIIELAAKNCRPNTHNAWKINQEAGFFGDYQES